MNRLTARRSRIGLALCLATVLMAARMPTQAQEPEQSEGPPLPLHSVEGTGGSFAVQSAYLVNPSAEGKLGMPSLGMLRVGLGNGRYLDSVTVTETFAGRLEIGYGWNYFNTGDLREDVEAATGITLGDRAVTMHNLNARVLLVNEGAYDLSWLPAVTFGVHYKHNDTVNDMDDDLGGTLSLIGIDDNDGWDFTLYASKLVTALPRPVIFTLGVRASEAAHLGLLGFTGDYEALLEGAVCVLLTNQLLVAAEYRQKPNDEYDEIDGLIEDEDDWWTLCAGYILSDSATIAVGYGHFGSVLNHEANESWGVAVKYEF